MSQTEPWHQPCFDARSKRDLLRADMPYAVESVIATVGIS